MAEIMVNIEFHPVVMSDRRLVRSYLDRLDYCSCEYTFANLILWGGIYRTELAEFDGRLYAYLGKDDCLHMPLGAAPPPGELRAVSESFLTRGLSGRVGLVPADYLENHPETGDWFTSAPSPAMNDYIYGTRDLVELRGAKLAKKKNLVAQFTRRHPNYEVVKLIPESAEMEACRRMSEAWFKRNGRNEEAEVFNRMLDLFSSLELGGLAVMVDGEAAAFCVHARQTPVCRDILLEKADTRFQGAAQVINLVTAESLLATCEYINRESDLGIPGLRQAKRSYAPSIVTDFWLLTPKK